MPFCPLTKYDNSSRIEASISHLIVIWLSFTLAEQHGWTDRVGNMILLLILAQMKMLCVSSSSEFRSNFLLLCFTQATLCHCHFVSWIPWSLFCPPPPLADREWCLERLCWFSGLCMSSIDFILPSHSMADLTFAGNILPLDWIFDCCQCSLSLMLGSTRFRYL